MQDGQVSFPPINTPLEEKIATVFGGRPLASMQNQVDPAIAARNQKIELDNFLQSRMQSAKNVSAPFQPDIVKRTDIDKSGRFSYQILGADNEDLYAQNQTWGSKAFNGTLKGLALAGTTFLQGTIGLVAGISSAIGDGEFNSLFNNDFSNAIQNFNNKTENWLPNYYTKQERNADWYSPKSWFTANFLFDSFIKNLGFSIGAIYSGAAVTKALKLVPSINSLFTGEKAVQALTQIETKLATVPALERTAEMANIIRQTSDAATKAVKFGNYAERAVVSTLGAVTEGGIEALQGVNEYRNALIQEYTTQYGVAPTGDVLEKINDNAENLGDARFLMNMALLTTTNYIQLPHILSSSYKTSKALANSEINRVVKNAEGKLVESFASLPKAVKLLHKAGNIGALFVSPVEGFEELSQYAVQLGVQDYYNKAYKGEGRNWVNSISSGWSDAVNSNEGMKQFLIGALSGGIQQSGIVSTKGFAKSGAIAERGFTGQGGERGKNTKEFISQANAISPTFKSEAWLKDMQAAAARGVNLQEEGEALIRQGDVLESKDNEADYMHNYLSVRIKHGRYDLVKDDIANFKQQGSTEQGLEELKKQNIANENDTVATFSNRIANFERHADNVQSLYQSLNLAYSGIKNRETGERVYSDDVIDKMVYAASKVADYDQRIPELSSDLLSSGVQLQTTIADSLSATPTGEDVKEAIKHIDGLPIIETKKDELKENLRDVLELSARRKQFLNEYKALKATPQAFKSKPVETTTSSTEPKKKITLKTKDGDEELEIGTEYYLGRVTEKDSQGHDVYRFPKLTIIGENPDGTIKIKGSDGVEKDVSKSVLEDYKLGRVDNLKNNKTANYYFNHINDVFQYNFGKESKLGKKRGRLEYKQDKLFFVYKDGSGKRQEKQLFREHFIAQGVFNEARLKVISTLQAESPEKKAAREEFLKEQTKEEKAAKEAEKQDARLKVVVEAQEETKKKLLSVKTKLQRNKERLIKIDEELNELKQDKKSAEARTKKEKARDEKYPELSRAKTKLAKIFRTVPKAISTLSKIKDDVEYDIATLTNEEEELEFTLSYLEDLGQNISELPSNSVLALQELEDQKEWINELIKETGGSINTLADASKKIEDTIKELSDLLEDAVSKFNAQYPSYIKEGFERMRNSQTIMAEIEVVKQYIADSTFIEDLQKEITLNEAKLSKISEDIQDLYKIIDQYGKELTAKESILNRFQKIADEFRAVEAAKKRYAEDKQLHDALFKAQSVIQEEPADTSDEAAIKATEDKDWEETKKQDLQQYPVSTAFTTREIDPTFESKPHLLREEAFLNNYAAGTLTDAQGNDIANDVRVLVVHQGNQDALGFPGLVEQRNTNEATQASTILYVYIAKGQGIWNIIDATGRTIGKLNSELSSDEPIDINQVVTSVAKTSTSIAQKSTHYTNKQSLDVKAVEKAWEAERQKLLQSQNTVLEIKGVSRGQRQITNNTDRNPITPTLTSQAVTDRQQVVHVSTTDVINTPNQSVFYKAGRPYFQLGDNIIFLNNRNINEQEANAIFLVLKEVATKFQASLKEGHPQLDKALVDWLNSVIYWYSPKKDQKAHNHQIYIKQGQLFISGVNTEIYFSPEQLEANREPIINTFLQGNQAGRGTYHHISQRALNSGEPYVSYYTTDGQTLKTKTYDSYQQYLLENKVVSTNVRPETSPTDSNIRGRYAIINIDLNLPKPEEKPKPTAKPSPTAQPYTTPKKIGKFTFEDMVAMMAANAAENVGGGETQEKKEEAPKPALTPKKGGADSGLKVEASIKLADLLKRYTGDVTNDDEAEYRRVIENDLKNVTPENWGAVEQWLKKNLPNVPVERVQHLLKMTGGGWAWGKFSKDGITLYDNAKEGTGYHEAFEAVWALFTTLEEKENVLQDIRKRSGTFFDVVYGKQQSYSSATNAQLKELLADEFAEFVQKDGAITQKTKGQFWLIRVFRGIFNFIKNLGKASQDNVDTLFKNINTGMYASRPVNLSNIATEEYSRVAGLSNQITKELMEDVTSRILNNFFGEKATLSLANLSDNKAIPLDLYYDKIKPLLVNKYIALAKEALAKDDEELLNTYINLAGDVDENWNDIVNLNKEYLKTFGIAKQENQDATKEAINTAAQSESSEDEQLNEETEGTFESDNKNQQEYDRDIFTISGKANASAGIRLLLSTIRDAFSPRQDSNDPSVLPKIEFKKSSIDGYRFVPYARVFNQLANALVNTNKIENILDRLIKHAKQNAPIIDLVRKLKINTTTGTINYSALSYDEWRILLDFTKTMSKQNPKAFVFINNGGTSQFVPGDKRSGVEQIKSNFIRIIKGTKSVFLYDTKTKMYKINPEFFKTFPTPTKEEEFIKFANAVGFRELDGEIVTMAGYRVLSPFEKRQFKAAISQLYTQLKKQEPVYDTKGKALQLSTPITTISSSIISMSKDDGVNTFLNILRKPIQSVVLNNPLATFFNNFNNSYDVEELNKEEKGLQEGFSHNSIVLQPGGRFITKDGQRTDEKIEVGYFDGYTNIKGSRQSAKLSLINRRLNNFNLNLRGWFIPITNGDKKTEWILSMGNNISFKEVQFNAAWDRIYPIFQNYLKTEIDVAQTDQSNTLLALKKQGRAGSLRFFLDILPDNLIKSAHTAIADLQDSEEFVKAHEEAINKAVKIFLEKEANKTKSEFYQYRIFEQQGDTKFYSFNGVDEKFIFDNINDNGANKWTQEQLDDVTFYRTVNQIVNNIELHKLIVGDPAYMTDAAKRIPGAMGGVNQTVYGSEEFNQTFAPLLNRVDVHNPSIALTPKDYGYTSLSEDVPIVVYNDVIVNGRTEGSAYKNTNETDGASKMSLPAYRELKTRSAEWTDQQERQYQYQMAFFRDRAQKWGYKYSSKELKKHDEALLDEGQPEDGIFEILKPKGWGQNSNSNYRDVVYLKTSTQPLIPTAIINTNDEKLLLKMLNSGIKIVAFESAIKTGARTLTKFYNEEGGFNTERYPKDGILKPTWKDLGIQVETQFSQGKKTLTLGSQLSTLSWLNLLSGGVPQGFTDAQWNKLSEEEKQAQSPSYKEIVTNDNILKELIKNGYNTLIDKLGVKETAGGYEISNPQAVITYLLEQARDMDDNTREALKIDAVTNQLATPLEAISTYSQLKAVLYSIVDKNIASPKTSGIGLVQMPSTGTESENRTTLIGNSTYKFYTKEEPWIEVSLPAWFREQLVRFYIKNKLEIPTDEKLLKLINDGSILDGIGFRIPTQELNSAEVFRIKSFLPKVMGNAVVVPSEITSKAGSDFDIDKLNAYLKNLTINKNGTISKIESFNSEQEATAHFEKEYEKEIQSKIDRIENYDEFRDALVDVFKAIESIEGDVTIDKLRGSLTKEQNEFYNHHISLMGDIIEQAGDEEINPSTYISNQIEKLGVEKGKLNEKLINGLLKDNYTKSRVRKSLENAYYESLQRLLQLPENFERLISTNTTKKLEDIKNSLNKALFTEEEIKENNINIGEKPALSYLSTLSPNSLDEIRHNLIVGKDGVGISAVAQKTNSVMQRLPVTLDHTRRDLLGFIDQLRVEYMGDGVIRFPHNTINGLPTISASKTKIKKNYISDIISQYINGFVDIVKNTFIIEMGINSRTAGTFLFMDRLGNDTEHTTYFMNQPIIREYLKLLDRMGINGIRSKLAITEIQERWGTDVYEDAEQTPSAKALLENIETYRDKNRDMNNLSTEYIREQAQIFNEFVKYQEMANDLFALIQGVTWDTAHMSDPEQFLLKDVKYWKANNTIFTPASEILSKVFIGDVKDHLLKARNAIGSFIAIEHPRVRAVLDELKRRFISPAFFPSIDEYSKTANRINNSFINYILQVKGQLREKTLKTILLDEVTSAAHLLEELKKTTPRDSDVYQILKQFSVERRGNDDDSVKAILFRKSGTDKYDRNSDIDNFRILKENGNTSVLYGKIVRAALLQSGTQYSPISFSNLIPNEDYTTALKDPIVGLPHYTDLDRFLSVNAFVRNNWSTNGVIPSITINKKQLKDHRDEGGGLWAAPFSLPKQLGNFPKGSIVTSIQNKGDFLKYQPINTEGLMKYVPGEHMLLNGKIAFQENNPILTRTYLYEIVKGEDNQPITIKGGKNGEYDLYVYKAINAWGDGMYAQEHFDSPRPSNINNNTYQIDENVVNDSTILKALTGKSTTFEKFKNQLPKKDCP